MSLEKFFTRNQEKQKSTKESKELLPMNTLPFLSRERREDIMEIVDFSALCVENYFKDFDLPSLQNDRFFLFTKNSIGSTKKDALGLYLPDKHAYGIRDDTIHAPHILIHEMVHYLAAEKGLRTGDTGYQFVNTRESNGENVTSVFYTALNEGMTDLIAQEIYSLYYKDLKHFFAGRGGMDARPSGYGKPIEFIQKLVDYNALILKIEQDIPDDEAHRQVWEELKEGYLTNDHKYLEKLFLVFVNSPEEEKETVSFIENLKPKHEHSEGFEVLISALDKKIVRTRKWYDSLEKDVAV